jgi:hypothetical protein
MFFAGGHYDGAKMRAQRNFQRVSEGDALGSSAAIERLFAPLSSEIDELPRFWTVRAHPTRKRE